MNITLYGNYTSISKNCNQSTSPTCLQPSNSFTFRVNAKPTQDPTVPSLHFSNEE